MTRRPVISTATGTSADAFRVADWTLLAAIALMWGSSFLFIAEAVETVSPYVVALGRLLFGAATLALFPGTRAIRVARDDWPQLTLLGLTWMAIPLMLFPVAQQWVDSSIAGMINGGVPLFAGLFAAVMLRRLPRSAQAIGLVIGFSGVVLITAPSATGAGGSAAGVALILTATAMYGLSVNLAVPLQQRYGALPVIARIQAVAIIVTLPFGLGGLQSSTWSWAAGGAIVVLGILGTGFAFVAMTTLVGRVGATRGSIAVYFIPFVAMVLGVVFRDERIPALAVAGIVLVLLGAWLGSRQEQ